MKKIILKEIPQPLWTSINQRESTGKIPKRPESGQNVSESFNYVALMSLDQSGLVTWCPVKNEANS